MWISVGQSVYEDLFKQLIASHCPSCGYQGIGDHLLQFLQITSRNAHHLVRLVRHDESLFGISRSEKVRVCYTAMSERRAQKRAGCRHATSPNYIILSYLAACREWCPCLPSRLNPRSPAPTREHHSNSQPFSCELILWLPLMRISLLFCLASQ